MRPPHNRGRIVSVVRGGLEAPLSGNAAVGGLLSLKPKKKAPVKKKG
jgi:hypothetical protein